MQGIFTSWILLKPYLGTDNDTDFIESKQGDSGGPMVCLRESSSSMVLYGITSWGIGCGGILPGLYVRVSKYVHWLQNIMGEMSLFIQINVNVVHNGKTVIFSNSE